MYFLVMHKEKSEREKKKENNMEYKSFASIERWTQQSLESIDEGTKANEDELQRENIKKAHTLWLNWFL